MDSIKDIALAKIAKFLTNPAYIKVYESNTVWQEILLMSGQKELYERNKEYLRPYYSGNFENYNFNRVYDSVYKIINKLYSNRKGMEELSVFLKVSVEKIKIINVISYDKDSCEEEERILGKLDKLKKNKDKYIEYIKGNLTDDFKEFIRCLNILSLDIEFEIDRMYTKQLISGAIERSEDISVLEMWLKDNYEPCYKSYNDAIDNFSNGRYGSCISDCRVTLTGLFSNFKETTEWFNGILQLNHENYKDENIIKKINESSKILNDKVGGQFPRFKAIYKIYGLLCDLGPHRNEGNKVEDVLILEEVTMQDSLMCLRFVEDILIWAMTTLNNKVYEKAGDK